MLCHARHTYFPYAKTEQHRWQPCKAVAWKQQRRARRDFSTLTPTWEVWAEPVPLISRQSSARLKVTTECWTGAQPKHQQRGSAQRRLLITVRRVQAMRELLREGVCLKGARWKNWKRSILTLESLPSTNTACHRTDDRLVFHTHTQQFIYNQRSFKLCGTLQALKRDVLALTEAEGLQLFWLVKRWIKKCFFGNYLGLGRINLEM